jgi:hypothetical protein
VDKRSWLAGPEAKLDRAVEHLETVERECGRFLKTKPYSVTAEFEPKTGDHVVCFRIRKQMPLSMSVRVGELIHDLRSALEHVAWVLACQTTAVEDLWKTPEKIGYPVAYTYAAFSGHSVTPFLSDAAKATLSPLQPYVEGSDAERHPLAHLHHLWNIDKHRVLQGSAGRVDLSRVTFVPKALDWAELAKGADVEHFPLDAERHLEDSAPLARVHFRGTHQPGTAHVEVKGEPGIEIPFKAGERGTTVSGLGGLCAHVANVLNAVRPLFPAP